MVNKIHIIKNNCGSNIYSIEGNLASGKSLILDHLQTKSELSIKTCKEPIEEWMNMNNGSDLLKSFYEDGQRWSFTFENLVQLSRVRTHQQSKSVVVEHSSNTNLPFLSQNEKALKVFTERSLWSSFFVFCKNSFEDKRITQVEYDILEQYFLTFAQMLNKSEQTHIKKQQSVHTLPFKVIYLKAKPETCYQRMKKRNRSSEDSVGIDYLTKIHSKYEDWINKLQEHDSSLVKIIDADQDVQGVIAQIDKLQI